MRACEAEEHRNIEHQKALIPRKNSNARLAKNVCHNIILRKGMAPFVRKPLGTTALVGNEAEAQF